MTEELKTCPFCGGTDIMSFDTGAHWVSCQTCGAEGPVVDDREDAVAKWNERQTVVVAQEPADNDLPAWEDTRVQIAYELLCSDKMPPNPEEHWEGYAARRIVAALAALPAEQPTTSDGALDVVDILAMGLCAKTAIKNGGAGHGCWWELGIEAKDAFRAAATNLLDRQSPAANVDLDYKLPCPVQVPPATMIGKGCKLSTLIESIRQREGKNAGFAFPSQPATSPAALEPFVRFAEQNTDENGWRSSIHRESISTWFGPSEFRALLDLRAQPVKEHDAIYLRGWNEGVERAAELLENEGSSTSAEKLKALLDGRSQPVSDDEPDTNDGEDYLNARRGHPGTVKNLSEPRG